MKKHFFSFFAASALLLAAASCSQDEFENGADGNNAQVSFSVNFEGGTSAATRTISDGKSVNKLVFAVYDAKGDELTELRQNNVTVSNRAAVVTTKLAKNQTYSFAFWAQNSNCTAYTTTDLKNVTVSYDQAVANDETRDAFFAAINEMKVDGAFTQPVTLKRPFAQLNVGVTDDDWNAAVSSGVEITQSSVTISQVATTLNLLDGTVGTPVKDVEFALAATPKSANETLDVTIDNVKNGYNYLSMNYLLVNNSTDATASSNVDATFTFKPASTSAEEITLAVPGVTVQRNYRTNIIGRMLTGDAQFNIKIDNEFDGNYIPTLAMDSKTLAELAKVANTKISLPAGEYVLPSVIADGVEIYGADGTILTISGSTIEGNNVVINGVQFKNDENAQYALNLKGLNPTLEDCTFVGAAGNGRAVNVQNTDAENVVTISGCDFSTDDWFKAIQLNTFNGTLKIDNTTMANGVYTFHIDAGSAVVEVSDSKIYGFTTNGASVESITFTNCEFGKAYEYACVNLYTNHTFINCTFPTKNTANVTNYGLYTTPKANGDMMVLDNCKLSDGTLLTTENFTTDNGGFVVWDSDAAACVWTINGISVVASDATLLKALSQNVKTINIALIADLNLKEFQTFGGADTESITIDGGAEKKILTITTSYWERFGNVVNPDAMLYLKNLTVDGNNSGTTWDSYNIRFESEVDMENVTFNRCVALEKDAKLTNVTINEATKDYYALWIVAGANVTITGGSVSAPNGRCIKISDQYHFDNPGMTTLNISGTSFESKKKAAILIGSVGGATIYTSNIDISKVTSNKTALCDNGQQYPATNPLTYSDYVSLMTLNGVQVEVEE